MGALGLNIFKLKKNGFDDHKKKIRSKLESLPPNKTYTSSLVDETSVYYRNDDKEKLMKLLLPDNPNGNRRNLDAIPIVGLAGVGKTTLAQIVYNDSRVDDGFEIKGWVSALGEFDILRLTENVLEAFSSEIPAVKTLNQLQIQLKNKLSGKKFLLVVDDLRAVKYLDWDFFQTPLKHGESGSKIIVTTRHKSVATILRTVPDDYCLEELSDEDCWCLLAKHAFDNENYSNLEDTGKEIAKKCLGLPAAAKVVGGLLRWERDLVAWQKLSETSLLNIWNKNILPNQGYPEIKKFPYALALLLTVALLTFFLFVS